MKAQCWEEMSVAESNRSLKSLAQQSVWNQETHSIGQMESRCGAAGVQRPDLQVGNLSLDCLPQQGPRHGEAVAERAQVEPLFAEKADLIWVDLSIKAFLEQQQGAGAAASFERLPALVKDWLSVRVDDVSQGQEHLIAKVAEVQVLASEVQADVDMAMDSLRSAERSLARVRQACQLLLDLQQRIARAGAAMEALEDSCRPPCPPVPSDSLPTSTLALFSPRGSSIG